MRINAKSTLTVLDIAAAVSLAKVTHNQDVYLDELDVGVKGAKQFWLASNNGDYSVGRNDPDGKRAASWTAWGYVIAELFSRDPSAHIGTYRGIDDFIAQVHAEHERYDRRRALGVRERPGEPGQDVTFLAIIGRN